MPEVYVYAQQGCTPEQTRVLVKEIIDAVVRNLKVEPELVMVQVIAMDRSGRRRRSVHRPTSNVIH
jgi:phenylpyruvate tautomerase PptA (4-oxalocrotonate tautomerase family)